jgi:AcrR family transcriptional regulator
LRGFTGFSYADIAAELHITKTSLHYHIAAKADLVEALITRYAARFAAAVRPTQSDGHATPRAPPAHSMTRRRRRRRTVYEHG